jgi:hypothetical protein
MAAKTEIKKALVIGMTSALGIAIGALLVRNVNPIVQSQIDRVSARALPSPTRQTWSV